MKVLVNSIEPTGKLGAEENSNLKVFCCCYDKVSAKSNREMINLYYAERQSTNNLE